MANTMAADIATIGRIDAVPAILQVICETTGMRFAAVARVTESHWTACAVLDDLNFGLGVGGELDLVTTLCHEIRSSHQTVVIDKASEDAQYCNHHTPRLYQFESYISVPVFRTDGSFFGTICALDPRPANLKQSPIQAMMESFARVLAIQLENQESHQRTEDALTRERQIAEVREQFIAVLGHDLRNPLFAISAGAELLLRKAVDDKSRGIIQHILVAGQRAAKLVEDVLDFARGRLGSGITVNLVERHDLGDALRHVVSEVQRVHPQRHIDVHVGAVDGLRCDRDRVAQLLSNLVANAIHHGAEQGPVTVSADIRDTAFVLSVHNLGEPIEAAIQAQLFQPFARRAGSSPQSGLGLGLYIANQIALAHGGHMEVVSTDEAGTRFTCHLPLQPVRTLRPAP
ncbi:GAF sensor signal transduction histidine kinase [Pseudomonas sp. M47T1]|uniref:GAF domain-containing sensor histidine kinase n=1 Tax=unclassified Pseudomonas TaxID=196821 RepID=UPI0002606B04|nr:GAF domain-containing sensor histidine kinase [Pseudomonas sp. M47T1]EIK98280.1 GAF sensor signal transduction histidine kinase [Pseudomonas sp. M47T1]